MSNNESIRTMIWLPKSFVAIANTGELVSLALILSY